MKFKERTLTNEIKEIRKFAKFQLIGISNHAKIRMEERGINKKMLFEALSSHKSIIVQDKPSGTYNNDYDRFVVMCKHNHKSYHFVIEKGITKNSTYLYRLVTCYEPSKEFFRSDGKLKKKCNRCYA